jgi:F0F1-type ATP synthase assembly protein I
MGSLVEAEKLMQIAILLPSSAIIGWLLGALADRWLHQTWIGIFGVIFGCIAGMVSVIQMALAAERNSRPGSNTQNGSGKGSTDLKP